MSRVPKKKWKVMDCKVGCGYHESKELCPVEGMGRSRSIALNFQVADVRKPLLAACRAVEKGNEGKFGPREEGNYIRNPKTGGLGQMEQGCI